MLKPYNVWGVIKFRANSFIELGCVNRAIEEYTKFIDGRDHWMQTFYERGCCYMLRSEWISAIVDLSCVINTCSGTVNNDASVNGESYISDDFDMRYCEFLSAVCFYHNGQHTRTLKILNALTSSEFIGDKKYWDKVYGLKGLCYVMDNKFDEAKKQFELAIEASPDVADYHWNLGRGLCGRDFFATPLNHDGISEIFKPYYEKAIELDPTYFANLKFRYVDNFIKVGNMFKGTVKGGWVYAPES